MGIQFTGLGGGGLGAVAGGLNAVGNPWVVLPLITVFTWTGMGDHSSWTDPANWDVGGRFPDGPLDEVVIDISVASAVLYLGASGVIGGLTLSHDTTLDVRQDLTVVGPFNMSAGQITFNSQILAFTLAYQGDSTWSGGNIGGVSDTGVSFFVLSNNSTLTVSRGDVPCVLFLNMTVGGGVVGDPDGSILQLQTSVDTPASGNQEIRVLPGATIYFLSTGTTSTFGPAGSNPSASIQIFGDGSTTGDLANSGAVFFLPGSDWLVAIGIKNNGGQLSVQSGATVEITQPATAASNLSYLQTSGILIFGGPGTQAATLKADGGFQITGGNMSIVNSADHALWGAVGSPILVSNATVQLPRFGRAYAGLNVYGFGATWNNVKFAIGIDSTAGGIGQSQIFVDGTCNFVLATCMLAATPWNSTDGKGGVSSWPIFVLGSGGTFAGGTVVPLPGFTMTFSGNMLHYDLTIP